MCLHVLPMVLATWFSQAWKQEPTPNRCRKRAANKDQIQLVATRGPYQLYPDYNPIYLLVHPAVSMAMNSMLEISSIFVPSKWSLVPSVLRWSLTTLDMKHWLCTILKQLSYVPDKQSRLRTATQATTAIHMACNLAIAPGEARDMDGVWQLSHPMPK